MPHTQVSLAFANNTDAGNLDAMIADVSKSVQANFTVTATRVCMPQHANMCNTNMSMTWSPPGVHAPDLALHLSRVCFPYTCLVQYTCEQSWFMD